MNTQHFMEQLELSRLMDSISNLFSGFSLSFDGLFERILSGNIKEALAFLWGELSGSLLHQVSGMKGVLASILILGILSVLVSGFMAGFESHQIADIAHYIFYLLLLAILLKIFYECYETAQKVLEKMVEFSRLILPTLCLAVGPALGTVTAAGYYELAMFFIFLVESFLLHLCLPVMPAFMLLLLMNGVWEEGRLSSLMELAENGVRMACKVALTAVTGLGVLQSMVAPALDSLKRGSMQKAVSAIPALGGLADGTWQLFLGSAVLVKNSLGLFSLLLLLLLLAPALWQLFCYGFLLKLSGALLGIVADKRLSACIGRAADAVFLLLYLTGAGTACFFILIAIITCLAQGG